MLLERLHAAPHAKLWAWAVLPLIGFAIGCFVGWLVKRFAPEAPGSGIPHVKGVLLHLRQMRWKKLIPVKFFGGVLGVGAGLSLGREGPTVQMGAAVGQLVADAVRLPPRLVPQLVSCGAGAGLAAAFNAPLAGFLFVLEELHREMSALTFGGSLIAALLADIIARSLTGSLPSFSIQGYPALPLMALPIAAAIGAIAGAIGVAFNKGVLLAQSRALSITAVPRWALPGFAAAICGLIAWVMPEAVGGGHSTAESLLAGNLQMGAAALLLLFLIKFGATLLSYASGAPGGIFAPMLLLGAIAGSLAGRGVGYVWPSLGPYTPALAVLGMAAFFTGSVRAPLTGIVLILEMTANYDQLLALGVACLAAYFVAESLRDMPIYEALLAADLARSGTASHESDTQPRSVVMGVQRGSDLEGRSIREAGLPAESLVVSVERAGREVMPSANLVILPGDHLTVLVPSHDADAAMRVVELARAK